MSDRGTFIVLEGGEGSGKTSIAERLKKDFPEIVYTIDPGGTSLGEQIRTILLSKKSIGMDARAELMLFLAARAQNIAEVIEPALSSGINVISTRFALSTIAYQIYGRERPDLLETFRSISNTLFEKTIPDATILLDVTPKVGIERVHARAGETTRFDDEQMAFHERVREGYKKHVGEFGKSFIVDSDRSLDEVWKEVRSIVQSLL